MANELQGAIDQIKSMLSTDEGQSTIESLLGTFLGGGSSDSGGDSNGGSASAGGSLESMAGIGSLLQSGVFGDMFKNLQANKIIKVVQKMNSIPEDDPGIVLLNALRPFYHEHKHVHIDNAIKLLMLAQIPELLKEEDDADV